MSFGRKVLVVSKLMLLVIAGVPAPAAAAGFGTFAECIRNSGAVMYGTSWCPVCRAQKKQFRGYANRLKYVDCTVAGSKKTSKKCKSLGINAFPTWIFGNGSMREGQLSTADLSSQTGCPVPD